MIDRFRVVVIGGGVAGTSIAYHLSLLGWNDVLLVDRSDLTSGSTFHSAGLVGQLRSSVTLTRMMMYGTDLYRRLADETGVDPGWHEVGSLRLASSKERMQELQRISGWAQTFGLPLQIISTEEAHERWPLFDSEGVQGAAWLSTDGHLDPSNLARALARGASARGATVKTNTRVTAISIDRGRVSGVVTHEGPIECEKVVDAGGMYAGQIGRLAGVDTPVVPFAHQYVLTEPIAGASVDMPTMRDPDRLVYFRGEAGGGLLMGGYERAPEPWAVETGPPADFNGKLLAEDWPRFLPLAESAQSLVPALRDAGIVQLVNGPEAFTPDGEFILGETEVGGFFIAAGFCAHGIAGAGGVGKVIAEWIVAGEPEWDPWEMDVRRFGPQYRSRNYALVRAHEVYATYYDIHYPGEERQAGRPLKMAPTYERLRALGAVFGEKSGWERANWFSSNEDPGLEDRRPRGWAGEHWSTAIVAEHLATRERAGLFDESSFAKIEVSGSDAATFMGRVSAGPVGRPPGIVTYTQLLNERGGIEADLTATRLAEDRYLLVTGTAFGAHDRTWLARNIRDGERVEIRDVTSSFSCFGLWGPRAREILQPITQDDLSNEAFPLMRARSVVVADVPCLALRVTYVGELGWELYPATEFAGRLWDTVLGAGRTHGVLPCGYRAIDSLRVEKGYRAWGADITPEEDPFQAGLGFAVDLEGNFIGKKALLARRADDRPGLACMVLEDPRAMVLGNEPVFADGHVLSRVTSGGIGYSIQRSIAFAYLPRGAEDGVSLEVEIFGERVGAEIVHSPLWDPTGERIKA